MTDKKTLSLAPREWNALLASNADDLVTFFKGQPMPNAELYQHIAAHLDRMKAILPGWLASAPAPVDAGQVAEKEAQAQVNGAAKSKKGGWPKGKKRNAPAQVVQ